MKNNRLPPKRILAVEDEPGICQVYIRALTRRGFEVDIAENGLVAQNMLEREGYDLFLIDIRTPVMNGKQLYQNIIQKHPEITDRVIFTVGDISDEYTQRFLELTERPFLVKPFSPDELMVVISKVIEQNRKPQPDTAD